MDVVETIAEVRSVVGQARRAGSRIGFVPTMGALHAGHRSLIARSRNECGFVAVSIFVNPTQFSPGEDFERYPRPMEADLQVCREERVDVVFAPSGKEIYPKGSQTTVKVGALAAGLCGPFRPGHFEGVATVVAKLLNIVSPDAAYFGEKDYQQLQIVRRMTRDLDFPVDIVGCPTVREADGLAVSSRNAYLSPAERRQAASIYAGLQAGAALADRGEHDGVRIVTAARRRIEAAGPCSMDYVTLVDAETLVPLESAVRAGRLCAAVRIGQTRLIDNVAVG